MGFTKNGSLTVEQIREVEKKLGHKFPNDYKEFLLKTNGGMIDFVIDDVEHGFHIDLIDEENVCIDSLYGVGEDACDLLIKYNKEYGEETGGCIIIGNTLSNGFIVYDYLGVVEDEHILIRVAAFHEGDFAVGGGQPLTPVVIVGALGNGVVGILVPAHGAVQPIFPFGGLGSLCGGRNNA